MGPQPGFDPMMFLALIPTILFVGLAIFVIRGRSLIELVYQRWVKEHRQRFIDKQ